VHRRLTSDEVGCIMCVALGETRKL